MGRILESDGKAIMVVFIGAIIAVALIALIANSVIGTTTGSRTILNETVVSPIANTTPTTQDATDLTGRSLLTTGDALASAIINATGLAVAGSGTAVPNMTLRDGKSFTTGLQTVMIVLNATSKGQEGVNVNVTYDFVPEGFVTAASGRAIVLLITIFSALAIAVFVLVVFIKTGALGRMMGR